MSKCKFDIYDKEIDAFVCKNPNTSRMSDFYKYITHGDERCTKNMSCFEEETEKDNIKYDNKEEHINHPSHYTKDGISENIEIIEALGYGHGFNIGNALKYLYRAGMKDKDKYVEDLKKARWYLDRAINNLENTDNTNLFDLNIKSEDLEDILVMERLIRKNKEKKHNG